MLVQWFRELLDQILEGRGGVVLLRSVLAILMELVDAALEGFMLHHVVLEESRLLSVGFERRKVACFLPVVVRFHQFTNQLAVLEQVLRLIRSWLDVPGIGVCRVERSQEDVVKLSHDSGHVGATMILQ